MSANKVQALEKGVRRASNILNAVGAGVLFALMLLGACDVIGRYIFNRPIMGALEISQVLLASMIFLSWGCTQMMRRHTIVEFLVSRFPSQVQARVNFGTTFLALLLFGVVVWQGASVGKIYWEGGRYVSATARWLPVAPFQFLVSVGAVVMCLVLLTQMLLLLPKMKGRA